MVTDDNVTSRLICIVDDDPEVRGSLDNLLRAIGYPVRSFAGPDEFIACKEVDAAACLILDVRLRDANGLDFQQELISGDCSVPVILMSGHGDVPMTLRGMRAGAVTFLTKPFDEDELLAAVEDAVGRDKARRSKEEKNSVLRARYEGLTQREQGVFELVTAGLMNKQIAGRLEISEITVKIHRGNMVCKMEADSLADLVRMAEALGVRWAVSSYNRG